MADGLTEAVTSVHDPEDGPYYYYLAYLAYLDAFLKPGQRRKGRKPHRVSGLCRWASQPTLLVGEGGLEPLFKYRSGAQKWYLSSSYAPRHRVGSASIGHVCAQNVPTGRGGFIRQFVLRVELFGERVQVGVEQVGIGLQGDRCVLVSEHPRKYEDIASC